MPLGVDRKVRHRSWSSRVVVDRFFERASLTIDDGHLLHGLHFEYPAAQHLGPQAASKVIAHELLDTARHHSTHPVARPALLSTLKLDALELKAHTDPFLKLHAFHDEISPEYGRRQFGEFELVPHFFNCGSIEKSHLPFVSWLGIEVAIPAKSLPFNALHAGHILNATLHSSLTLLPPIVMPAGNVNMHQPPLPYG